MIANMLADVDKDKLLALILLAFCISVLTAVAVPWPLVRFGAVLSTGLTAFIGGFLRAIITGEAHIAPKPKKRKP